MMMRLWLQSYEKTSSVAPIGAMSTVIHALVIAAWVYSTMPGPNVPRNSLANRVVYVVPADRVPGPRVVHEVLRYVESSMEGPGVGEGPSARRMGEARPVASDESMGRTPPALDTAATAAREDSLPPGTADSVFSVLEVDTAVVRSANSAAPVYPAKLLDAHISGSVSAQYVVDTSGLADTASFLVLESTHPEFIVAVREALPYMRFTPAKVGSLKVRQLVEQQFSFRIADAVVSSRTKRP